ncbi:MAG: TonB-dependent receptor [Agarilytica sp.]
MKSFFKPLVLLSFSISPLVNASDQYEQVVVSASLTETTTFDVLGSASVVSAEDIVRVQPIDLADILDKQAGLDISKRGGSLSSTSLFLRGSNNGHTVILINGQRFNSATLGESQFALIDPEQIERVEVVRGGRSSLYGTDAIGGVVNIITKRPADEMQGFVAGQYGSFNTGKASAGISNRVGALGYQFSLSGEVSDGIDNLVDDEDFNDDEDAYEIFNFNTFLDYQINEQFNLNFSHLESQSESEYDNSSGSEPFTENTLRVSTFDIDASFLDSLQSTFSASQSLDNSITKDRQARNSESEIETSRSIAKWTNYFSPTEHSTFIFGAEHLDEHVSGDTTYDEDDRYTTAGFFQYEGAAHVMDVQIGGRHDESSDYGSIFTYTAGLGVNPVDNIRLYSTYSEGFKAPTFNDLYWPGLGNSELQPEQSTSREIGAKLKLAKFFTEVALYNNDVKDLIEWAQDSEGTWLPSNVASASLKGHDIMLGYTEGFIQFKMNYSRADARDNSDNTRLGNRAKHKLSIDLSGNVEKLTTGVIFRTQSDREATGFMAENAAGYAVYDIYASFEIGSGLSTSVKVNNAFDRDYQYDERYNAEGRNVSAKLSYTF